MVRQLDAQRRMPGAAVAAAVALGLALAGCGSEDFANEPRPRAPLTVSTAIAAGRVTVSPAQLSPGTIELIASNQTRTSQRVTLRSSGRPSADGALEQSTGPINPGDTASLRAQLRAGGYVVSVDSPGIDPARIVVVAGGPADGDGLLQP